MAPNKANIDISKVMLAAFKQSFFFTAITAPSIAFICRALASTLALLPLGKEKH